MVVHLISLSMCAWRGEVLDISIIGLAIGGHVHMLPHLSSHTTAPGLVGFDCQLYVTTHSQRLPLSDGVLVDMAAHNFNSSQTYNI